MSTAIGIVVGILVVIVAMAIWRYVRSRRPTVARSSPTSTTASSRIDKNVQFTVYRPTTILPEKWYPLVAFAHLAKRREDAPKDELDPIQEVQRQATKLLSDQSAKYEAARLDRGFTVPQQGTLTFVPIIEGCEFNPPSASVQWQRSVHKVEFEMKASASVDKQDIEGQVTVYLGNIILTEVPLRLNVDSGYVAPESTVGVMGSATAEPYRKIFASYSHKDTAIVEDFENYVESLGDEYLRDVRTLRSGQKWSEELERMIRDASVFQLFWSSNSMISDYVKQEWEYALSLNRNKFIRPVYWEEPLPKKDPDLPPKALSDLHFYKIGGEHAKKDERGALAATLPAASIEDNLELRSGADSLPSWGSPMNAVAPAQSTAPWWGVFSPLTLKFAFTAVIFAFVGAPVLLFFMTRESYEPFGTIPPSPAPTSTLDPTPSPTMEVIDPNEPLETPTTAPTPIATSQPSLAPTPVLTPSVTPTPKPTATSTPTVTPPRSSPISVSVQPAEFRGRITSSVYRLTIKNVSDKPITNLVVTEPLPEEVGFSEASPQPSRNGQTLVWQHKELPTQQSFVIAVRLTLQRQLSVGESVTLKQRTIITYVDGEGRRRRYQPRE